MSYQQPPPGYPPQPGYQQPQAPAQPQYQAPAYQPQAFKAGDGLTLPPNLLVLSILLLLAGVFFKAIIGFFNPGKAWQYISTIGGLMVGLGEIALGGARISAGRKEKEHANGVTVTAIIVGGLLIIHALSSDLTGMMGLMSMMARRGG